MSKKNNYIMSPEKTSGKTPWEIYKEYISSLYLTSPVRKETNREKLKSFFIKLIFVFAGAFLTTFSFNFLLDRNGLYNNGINGLIQTGLRIASSYGFIENFYLWYYLTSLLVNFLTVMIFWIIFRSKIYIIGTAVFYVVFQIFWNYIFNILKLKDYLFSQLSPQSWSGVSSHSQLGFTLPFYIFIALVAAIIHMTGYSIIFKAKATPGGLEIISSHFSSKKKNFSLANFTKFFGFLVIFLITLVDFSVIEDNKKIKQNQLFKALVDNKIIRIEKREEIEEKILPDVQRIIGEEIWLKEIIEKKQKELEKIAKNDKTKSELELEIKNYKKKNELLRTEEKYPVVIFLKEISKENDPNLLFWEVNKYLFKKRIIIIKLEEKLEEIQKKIDELGIEEKEKLENRKELISNYLQKAKNEFYEKTPAGYLKYVTNNERLWGTLVYVFFSAYWISKIFPRNKIVMLKIYCSNEENRNIINNFLKKFSPVHYWVYSRKEGEDERKIYVVDCFLNKWDYGLISSNLKKFGVIYANEIN